MEQLDFGGKARGSSDRVDASTVANSPVKSDRDSNIDKQLDDNLPQIVPASSPSTSEDNAINSGDQKPDGESDRDSNIYDLDDFGLPKIAPPSSPSTPENTTQTFRHKVSAWGKHISDLGGVDISLMPNWSGITQEKIASTLSEQLVFLHDNFAILENPDTRKIEDIQALMRPFIYSFFLLLTRPLSEQDEPMDLEQFGSIQKLLYRNLPKDYLNNILLEALQKQRTVTPVPEFHWRVNRSPEDYKRRVGFDLISFLKAFQTSDSKVLLEFGQGNGTFKKAIDTDAELKDSYDTFGLSDRLHFPIDALMENCLKYEKLAEDLHAKGFDLTPQDISYLSSLLYKVLVMKNWEPKKGAVTYDQDVMDMLKILANSGFPTTTDAIESLKRHLKKKMDHYHNVPVMPHSLSGRDMYGNVVYKHALSDPSKSVREAWKLLQKDLNAHFIDAKDISSTSDILPVHTQGTVIGKFEDINKLAKNQIDVTIAVRSTVYVKGKNGNQTEFSEWKEFLVKAIQALKKDGIMIDDSVRDNDGWFYRLAELKEVQDTTNTPAYIIVGPRMPGEDYAENVPLAFIVTSDEAKINHIKNNLLPGYSLRTLDDTNNDTDFLTTLNSPEDHTNPEKITALKRVQELQKSTA